MEHPEFYLPQLFKTIEHGLFSNQLKFCKHFFVDFTEVAVDLSSMMLDDTLRCRKYGEWDPRSGRSDYRL